MCSESTVTDLDVKPNPANSVRVCWIHARGPSRPRTGTGVGAEARAILEPLVAPTVVLGRVVALDARRRLDAVIAQRLQAG